MFTAADRINWINIALMLLTLAAAVAAPFHLFLLAYAVLGPLHYLTEVSWLHDRSFFTPSGTRRNAWLTLVIATAAVMVIGYVSELVNHPLAPTLEIGMFLLVFIGASAVCFVRHAVNAISVVALAVIGMLAISASPAYGIIAYLLMTIVHVFVFTGIFILAGASKTKSTTAYLSFGVFVFCAAAALLADIPARPLASEMRTLYTTFEQLNALLLKALGESPRGIYETAGIRIMRFVAFAYTYHYLNWFSKTTIIKWHAISNRRTIAIGTAWVAGLGLYAIDYRVGFAVSYLLSVVHVMLEFPLNQQTIMNLLRNAFPVAPPRLARAASPLGRPQRA